MYEHAATTVSDEEPEQAVIVSADPGEHVERIKEVERLGATVVALMNVSGADPHGAIATYRDHVLPHLR